MPELIDKQSALSVCKEYCWLDDEDFVEGYNTAIKDMREAIKELHTIEPEVRRGRWIVHTTWLGMFGLIHSECSECKFDRNGDLSSWQFCPNCGAKMSGEDTNVSTKGGADNG